MGLHDNVAIVGDTAGRIQDLPLNDVRVLARLQVQMRRRWTIDHADLVGHRATMPSRSAMPERVPFDVTAYERRIKTDWRGTFW